MVDVPQQWDGNDRVAVHMCRLLDRADEAESGGAERHSVRKGEPDCNLGLLGEFPSVGRLGEFPPVVKDPGRAHQHYNRQRARKPAHSVPQLLRQGRRPPTWRVRRPPEEPIEGSLHPPINIGSLVVEDNERDEQENCYGYGLHAVAS